jgi:hypothetical protein
MVYSGDTPGKSGLWRFDLRTKIDTNGLGSILML